MALPDSESVYLDLAKRLYQQEVTESTVAEHTLPPLDRPLLSTLADKAEQEALFRPRYGWAIMAVADAAALQQNAPPFLQALSAWHLAHAASGWLRPRRVKEAIDHARPLFQELGRQEWVAACEWLLHDEPWMRNHFQKTEERLSDALAGLERAGFEQFIPRCRLALGYAHLFTVRLQEAIAEITRSEETFRERDDRINLARCLTIKASAFRRQGNFDEALDTVAEAISLVQREQAPLVLALARYRQAWLHTLRGTELEAAEETFLSLAETYKEADLPLLRAQCYSALDRLYRETGRLRHSEQALTTARQIYVRFNVLGLRADNFVDSGQLAALKGEYKIALNYYANAQALYESIGVPYMTAVALMYQGEIAAFLGRYQRALQALEDADRQFQSFEDLYRRTECALQMARVWVLLNRPRQALSHLDTADGYLHEAGRTFFLTELYASRAEALFMMEEGEAAISLLITALEQARQHDLRVSYGHLKQFLGEGLCRLNRPQEALPHLEEALAHYQELGLTMMAASTLVVLGECYDQLGRPAEARRAWRQALDLNKGIEPETEWQARAGLAALAADKGKALAEYRQAVATLVRVRRDFWQSSLAGAYLHRPVAMLERALALAAEQQEVETALSFVEAGKAHTMTRQMALLDAGEAAQATKDRPVDLVEEIRWLTQQIEASVQENAGFIRPAAERRLRQQLLSKMEAYEQTIHRLQRLRQRQTPEVETDRSAVPGFDLAAWRRLANESVTSPWMALNYYLADGSVYCVLVTADTCQLFSQPLQPRLHRAIERWGVGRPRAEMWNSDDLAALGSALLPDPVTSRLAANGLLIIVPHGPLHRLPWTALECAGASLVSQAVPLLTPSLTTLGNLWQRARPAPSRANGLLLAVSRFGDRRPALPEVETERQRLQEKVGDHGDILINEEATWQRLQEMSSENGLAHYAFWHVASHAFHDGVTGRLSGIALYDRDMWLDEVWECAPLPPLVVLSACSGNRSHVYTGDEHVGLATTCLAAGARQVVGSLWPIQDQLAADFISRFYDYYLAGHAPGYALTFAQRSALEDGVDTAHWSSFVCIGSQ